MDPDYLEALLMYDLALETSYRWSKVLQAENNTSRQINFDRVKRSAMSSKFIYVIITTNKTPEILVKIAEVPTSIMIDTGLSVNILDYKYVKKTTQ